MTQTEHIAPGTTYVVQAGDSLWAIAVRAYGNGLRWPSIYDANKQVIGNNPNLIHPGQVLHIPGSAPPPNLPLRNSTEIQGDILAGFNKDHRMYLFLCFPNQANGRSWLKEVIPFIGVTSNVAAFNAEFSSARGANKGVDPTHLKSTWVNVSLTYEGLKLVLKDDPAAALNAQGFTSFVNGPVQSASVNGDTQRSDPANWKVGRTDQTIHALLNIQADDPNDLIAEVQKLTTISQKLGVTIVFEQAGATLPAPLTGHEHFGFKDGISQPGVAGFDFVDPNSLHADPSVPLGFVLGHPGTEIIQAGEFVLGQPTEADSGGQAFPQPADPGLKWMVNGSFQVFRRLNQDVPGFMANEDAVLGSLPSNDPLHASLGAKLVGRWKSGTSLDLSPDSDTNILDDARINHFNYMNNDGTADDDGFRCPRFAHIRKVYPRERDFGPNRGRRIMRRGVPFGLPFDASGGSGTDAQAERGLVFVAYMSSIENKFEFLSGAWVNSSFFPVSDAGPDPIIGAPQQFPTTCTLHRQQGNLAIGFEPVVFTTGTLYAFVPPMSALKAMANGTL